MNLEGLKRKRLEELQSKFSEEQEEQLRLKKQLEVLEDLIRQYLSKEAISRYGLLKSAHPEKAIQVISLVVQAIQSKQIKEKLSDEEFKNLLRKIDEIQSRKEFRILKR